MSTPSFYTLGQLAVILKIHPNSVKRFVDDGRLPRPVKLSPGRSGRVRFPVVETDAALEALRASA
ncbi:MAG TPA: helix-turn-helix domain-containing protein [Stellaceae bacterium]|nr:helix-turn-helix domain-containing protein [Stellaceae bacterium]